MFVKQRGKELMFVMSSNTKTAEQVNQYKIDELSPLLKRVICLMGVTLNADNREIRNLAMKASHKEN